MQHYTPPGGNQLSIFGNNDDLDITVNRPNTIGRSASVSPCGVYRWWLRRDLPAGKGIVTFIMLNPSKADHTVDDPTMTRVQNFASGFGFKTIHVVNLFPFRSSEPKDLMKAGRDVATGGERGMEEIVRACSADRVIVAWGSFVPFARETEVLKRITATRLYCLGYTAKKQPRHPLMLKGDTQLEPFKIGG